MGKQGSQDVDRTELCEVIWGSSSLIAYLYKTLEFQQVEKLYHCFHWEVYTGNT